MVQICPITDKKVNENATRVSAFYTFILVILFVTFSAKWSIILLATDFILRGFFYW
jgi:hypothetical protein